MSDYPQVKKGERVTFHGDKDKLMEIVRFGGTGDAWLTHKKDEDGFWAREGEGPGEWEPIPPRKKPKKQPPKAEGERT